MPAARTMRISRRRSSSRIRQASAVSASSSSTRCCGSVSITTTDMPRRANDIARSSASGEIKGDNTTVIRPPDDWFNDRCPAIVDPPGAMSASRSRMRRSCTRPVPGDTVSATRAPNVCIDTRSPRSA